MFREIIDTLSLWLLPSIILLILTTALLKKVPIYETFIDGAKDGVKVSLNIVPYLVAIIVAISMLRASGAIESFAALCSPRWQNSTCLQTFCLWLLCVRYQEAPQ